MNNKKTAGQVVIDAAKHLENKPLEIVSIVDLQREMLNADEFTKKMLGYIDQGKKAYKRDFYIELNLKREKLIDMAGIPQSPRSIPFLKTYCPTPFYDQSVWKYHYKTEKLEYLWTVPDRDTCNYYRKFALQVVPEERELLGYVLSYYDGSLLNKAKELNGEKKDTPSVIVSVIKE